MPERTLCRRRRSDKLAEKARADAGEGEKWVGRCGEGGERSERGSVLLGNAVHKTFGKAWRRFWTEKGKVEVLWGGGRALDGDRKR